MGSTTEVADRPARRRRDQAPALPSADSTAGLAGQAPVGRPDQADEGCLSADPEHYTHGVIMYHPTGSYPRHRIVFRDAHGKRQQRSAGRVCSIARGIVAEVIADLEANVAGVGPETVADLVPRFLTKYHGASSLRHAGEVGRRLRDKVVPVIGHVPVARLRRVDVRAAIEGAGDEHPDWLRKKLRTDLGPFLAWLEDNEYLPQGRGAVMPAKPPRTSKNRKKSDKDQFIDPRDRPSPEDCRTIAEALREVTQARSGAVYAQRMWLMSALSSATGVRIGEVIELRARDFADLSTGELRVARQLVTVPADGQGTPRRRVVTDPKWGKIDNTVLPARTLWGEDLHGPLAELLAGLGAEDLLFPSPRGQWIDESNFDRDRFKAARARAGGAWAERWSWHQHRHAFCSALLVRGAAIADVSRVARHEQVSTTINMYVGATKGATDRIADLF